MAHIVPTVAPSSDSLNLILEPATTCHDEGKGMLAKSLAPCLSLKASAVRLRC